MSYRQKGMASARSPYFCLLWSAMIPKKILLCQLLTFFSRISMNVILFELPTLTFFFVENDCPTFYLDI